MPARNNVTRLLANRKIPHEVIELPAEKLSAVEVAARLGASPEVVYKTIVVARSRGRPLLVMVPATHEVNLKALAADLGEKKLRLPTQAEAERLTGLQAGGISALALRTKSFDICLDAHAQSLDEIHISAGQRGLQVRLPVVELVRLTGARWVTAA